MALSRRAMLGGALATALPLQAAAPRPFRMGVTRWPPDLTKQAEARVEAFLRARCDMSAPMVLGGVPWAEAASGAPFSPRLTEELTWRAPRGHKTLLSLSALDMARRALAPYYGATDNQPLPPDFAGKAFDDPLVLRAYADFCLRAVEMFRPDWLVIGVEVNLLAHQRPEAWPAYKRLHAATYRAVKARHPDLPVAFTIEALRFLGLADGADADRQRHEMTEMMAFSDLAAFSVYPHMSWEVPRPLPADFFDFMGRFGQAVGKPVAVSESGFTARRVMVGLLPLFGSPQAQARHLDLLLRAADRDRFAFVVNFASHDFGPLTARLKGRVRQLAKIWTYTGLLGSDGAPKPATQHWDAAFARPLAG